MYNLIKLTADFDDSFVFFIISKDVHKTFNYLATQINSKNVNNPLFKFLVTNRKKLYDLNREIVFSSVKLDEIETEKRILEGKQPREMENPQIKKLEEAMINQPKIIVEEPKTKQKRTYNKKNKTNAVNITKDSSISVEENNNTNTVEVISETKETESQIESDNVIENETITLEENIPSE
ncbi:MAG: hypothetical protein KC589_06555 [Nanoarchaeota archaeon]|nr:hypothetical protein [Nanoarchaeota archaeon]